MNVLVLNCGSSSAKFAVIDSATGAEKISGIAQRLDSAHATLDWKLDGQKHSRDLHHADHDLALRTVVELLRGVGLADDLAGVGHRVVHGGARFSGSMPITEEVVAKIEECIPLGPLHNPPNLLGIRISQELFPTLPQVAVFDTAFHQTMPPRAYLYAVPYEWFEKHEVRRYGFHGTSHRYVSEQAVRLIGAPPLRPLPRHRPPRQRLLSRRRPRREERRHDDGAHAARRRGHGDRAPARSTPRSSRT